MNEIGHKDIEAYVRNLIFEKFESRKDAKERQDKNKEDKVPKCSISKPDNLAANQKDNRIANSS